MSAAPLQRDGAGFAVDRAAVESAADGVLVELNTVLAAVEGLRACRGSEDDEIREGHFERIIDAAYRITRHTAAMKAGK